MAWRLRVAIGPFLSSLLLRDRSFAQNSLLGSTLTYVVASSSSIIYAVSALAFLFHYRIEPGAEDEKPIREDAYLVKHAQVLLSTDAKFPTRSDVEEKMRRRHGAAHIHEGSSLVVARSHILSDGHPALACIVYKSFGIVLVAF